MDIKEITRQLTEALDAIKQRKALKESIGEKIKFGIQRETADTVYFTTQPSINLWDFCDCCCELESDGSLFEWSNNDRDCGVGNTGWHSLADIEKHVKETLWNDYLEDHYLDDIVYVEHYDEDEYFQSPEELWQYVQDFYNESYVDGDSNDQRAIVNPKTFEIVLGVADFCDWEDACGDYEDVVESLKTRKSFKKKLKESKKSVKRTKRKLKEDSRKMITFKGNIQAIKEQLVGLAKVYGEDITISDLIYKLGNSSR